MPADAIFPSFKITTDEGIIGWSEYNEGYGSAGITAVIRRMATGLIGEPPRAVERIMSTLSVVKSFETALRAV